jgi:uncharacterized protein (UPF0333 family)
MMRFLNNKGQNTAEYAVLIGLVVAAAIAMQTYVKRGLQGGIKFAVDKSAKSEGTAQYEPYYLESKYNTAVSAYKDTEETQQGGSVLRIYGADSKAKTITRSGYQKTRAATEEDKGGTDIDQ